MSHSQRIAIVTETGSGKYQNQIQIGEHSLIASEPADLGGDDSGPTPVELLNAALGSCTSITLRMYADRKKWPVEGIQVEVTHKRGHLEACAGDEGQPKGRPQDIFTKNIQITGPLDEKQRKRMLDIAEKCPVHRVLKDSVCLRSRLVS